MTPKPQSKNKFMRALKFSAHQGNNPKNEKATYGMGENICKLYV
jgi:hypothetical protein